MPLFMIVERFDHPSAEGGPSILSAVAARFRERGRLIPAGSPIGYIASWMAADGGSCYQLMQSPDCAALCPWIDNWSDLVRFEVVEVRPSAEYWANAEMSR